jgi:2-polyprenyl-3-methyl-5-hydroxy-6-metoxy-1,4-benzoquinol methylase
MSSEALNDYYRENFGGERHLKGQRVNARINATVLTTLLGFDGIRNWLDIGTGYGFLLDWLKKSHGIDVEGVELSLQEAEYAQKELGLSVHAKLLSQSNLPHSHFDIVSSFEVIEHISDPVAFLTELTKYVRPGGRLIVMTDNFESEPVRQLRGSFPKWIPHTHVSHFSAPSLRKCIKEVPGLTLEKEGSYTPWDVLGRQLLAKVRQPSPDDEAFDLTHALATEMSGETNYKFYRVRYFLNPIWARLSLRATLASGAVMYAVCRRSF